MDKPKRDSYPQHSLSPEGKLSKKEVIALERKLAKFANIMDSMVRIPFTKQGVGADAALSSAPVIGDMAGLVLTGYAFALGLKIGVPARKMMPAVQLAIIDMIIGIVPAAGTLLDVFIRPSRKTVEIVHEHIREHYEIENDLHIGRPFLHESLEKKQQRSGFWRNPVISWVYLHIPDLLGAVFLIIISWAAYVSLSWLFSLWS